MKLQEFLLEQAIVAARPTLLENVSEYLSLVLGKLKNKGAEAGIDLDHLAKVIVGLKIITDPTYRSSITKADVGVSLNNAQELYNLLNGVDKQGNDSKFVKSVFDALASLAPSGVKRQKAELDNLKSPDQAERDHEVRQLEQLVSKVAQIFGKIKSATAGEKVAGIPKLGTV